MPHARIPYRPILLKAVNQLLEFPPRFLNIEPIVMIEDCQPCGVISTVLKPP
jgi:hypothetical protein